MEALLTDTIVALSSAPPKTRAGSLGRWGRAIVRLSGPKAFEFADRIIHCRPPLASGWEHDTEKAAGILSAQDGIRAEHRDRKPPVALRRAPGWRRVRGELHVQSAVIPAVAYVMPGPRSYTRQDIVEIHLPAVQPLMTGTLDAAVHAGARPALPGEFTRRALLNGRVSLAQAEAIGALIRAEHEDEARAHAERVTKGPQPRVGVSLRDDLDELLSLVELGLDFSAEDVETLSRIEMLRRIRALGERYAAIARQAALSGEEGLQSGLEPRVVLAGPTNAGKSSLFNALLGKNAAIVSGSRHTTRDIVEARYRPGEGPEVVLIDTAGHSDTAGGRLLERALDSAACAICSADVLLLAADGQERETEDAAQDDLADYLQQALKGRTPAVAALLWTKCDLPRQPDWLERAARYRRRVLDPLGLPSESVTYLDVSAVSGEGLPELHRFLENAARVLFGRISAARTSSQAAFRHASARCAEALHRAGDALAAGLGEDAAVVELREAAHALSQSEGVLLGHDALTESLLDRIFARFCIGK